MTPRIIMKNLIYGGIVLLTLLPSFGYSQSEIPGITKPLETVEIAAAESGLLVELDLKVGDRVEAGKVIGRLENDVQKMQLAIAEHLKNSIGEAKRVEADLQMKQSILEHFEVLSSDGFALKKELLRAQMDLESAKANVLARQEKHLENIMRHELAAVQLIRRNIISPISGRVSVVHRQAGEYVSVANPAVVTVVQTNPILAEFQVPLPDLPRYQIENVVTIKVGSREYEGKIKSIGFVVTSETIPVEVLINNDSSELFPGQKCRIVSPQLNRKLVSHSR